MLTYPVYNEDSFYSPYEYQQLRQREVAAARRRAEIERLRELERKRELQRRAAIRRQLEAQEHRRRLEQEWLRRRQEEEERRGSEARGPWGRVVQGPDGKLYLVGQRGGNRSGNHEETQGFSKTDVYNRASEKVQRQNNREDATKEIRRSDETRPTARPERPEPRATATVAKFQELAKKMKRSSLVEDASDDEYEKDELQSFGGTVDLLLDNGWSPWTTSSLLQ